MQQVLVSLCDRSVLFSRFRSFISSSTLHSLLIQSFSPSSSTSHFFLSLFSFFSSSVVLLCCLNAPDLGFILQDLSLSSFYLYQVLHVPLCQCHYFTPSILLSWKCFSEPLTIKWYLSIFILTLQSSSFSPTGIGFCYQHQICGRFRRNAL